MFYRPSLSQVVYAALTPYQNNVRRLGAKKEIHLGIE
jgi:hypothetical protein